MTFKKKKETNKPQAPKTEFWTFSHFHNAIAVNKFVDHLQYWNLPAGGRCELIQKDSAYQLSSQWKDNNRKLSILVQWVGILSENLY